MGKNSKDRRDVYNRLAKESNWRARSVFKLLQVNEEMHILDAAVNVVDLCAAPGSWSQALQQILSANSDNYKIVSVDLQKIEPIEGVTTLIGDITKESTAKDIISNFHGNLADVVVCDGAADITGIHSLDESFHYFIFTAAIAITSHLLVEGGHFVIKIFQGIHTNSMVHQVGSIFEEVRIVKPLASRKTSAEAFLVAKRYRPPKFFRADLSQPAKLLRPPPSAAPLSMDEKKLIDAAANLLKYVMYGGYDVKQVVAIDNNSTPRLEHVVGMTTHALNHLNLNYTEDSSLEGTMNLTCCIVDIREQSLEMVQQKLDQQVDGDGDDEFNDFFTTLINQCL